MREKFSRVFHRKKRTTNEKENSHKSNKSITNFLWSFFLRYMFIGESEWLGMSGKNGKNFSLKADFESFSNCSGCSRIEIVYEAKAKANNKLNFQPNKFLQVISFNVEVIRGIKIDNLWICESNLSVFFS